MLDFWDRLQKKMEQFNGELSTYITHNLNPYFETKD